MCVIIALFVSLLAFGQDAHLDAPWLTVYDAAGRPRWEVKLEALTRDADGWQGRDAHITMYHEGQPQARLLAAELVTDPLGREWDMPQGVEGEWGVLNMRAARARWERSFTLWEVEAWAEDIGLRAAEARWTPGSSVEFSDVQVSVQGWELEFPAGSYHLEEDVLQATDVDLRGHGLKAAAGELRVSARGGEVTLTDAELSPAG